MGKSQSESKPVLISDRISYKSHRSCNHFSSSTAAATRKATFHFKMNSLRFFALWALFLAINMAQAYANWINDIGADVEKSGNEVEDMGKDLDKIFAQDFFSQN